MSEIEAEPNVKKTRFMCVYRGFQSKLGSGIHERGKGLFNSNTVFRIFNIGILGVNWNHAGVIGGCHLALHRQCSETLLRP